MKRDLNRSTGFFYSSEDRIKNTHEIRKLFHHGKAFLSYPLRIILLEQQASGFRTAVIAPKKILRKAHQRNRIKRKLRELIRLSLPELRDAFSDRPFDFLLIYEGKTPDVKYAKLKHEYDRLLEQLHQYYDTEISD